MLARYRIVRGKRPPDHPLPDGTRLDTRKHTKHCLRPTVELVESALSDGSEAAWVNFEEGYARLLHKRWTSDPAPFEALAGKARVGAVYLGCNCPTKKQPAVGRCHTILALRFMRENFPDLDVRFP